MLKYKIPQIVTLTQLFEIKTETLAETKRSN